MMKRKASGRSGLYELSAAAAAALLLICGISLAGKEKKAYRVLSGVVSDQAENPIGGAAVTLTEVQTGKKMATYANADGVYQFSSLEFTYDYQVQATSKGGSSRVRKVSMVDPRSRITFNLQIPPPKEDE